MSRLRLLLGLVLAGCLVSVSAMEQIILDTDLGDDVDDAGTFAVMHALADRGDIGILAVGIVNGNVNAVPLADAINTFYGRPDLPLGTIKAGAPINRDTFQMGAVAAAYPHDLTQDSAPDVVALYRRILAGQPDRSVTLVVIGQATNIANLLKSPADAISPLDGVALMRQKVKFYAAGGNGRATLPDGLAGWNYKNDLAAAAYELQHLPVEFPTVFAGGSGLKIKVGSCYLKAPANHIVRVCYEKYFKGTAKDRPTWDQIRLLYASCPAIRSVFDTSAPGSIVLDQATGRLTWTATPDRNRSYAYARDMVAVRNAVTELMMHGTGDGPDARRN